MRSKSLLLAILLATLLSGVTAAQTSHSDALDAIRQGNEKYSRAGYESAIAEYRKVPPGAGELYAQSLYNIGVCYYELWRTEDAIRMYRRAVEARDGRYPKALYALGVALEDSGRLAEAKEVYKQSTGILSEGYATAQYRLGLLTAREGDYRAAATMFREAIARSLISPPRRSLTLTTAPAS
jgi:tetratricopeptide (TPR) repeat protein